MRPALRLPAAADQAAFDQRPNPYAVLSTAEEALLHSGYGSFHFRLSWRLCCWIEMAGIPLVVGLCFFLGESWVVAANAAIAHAVLMAAFWLACDVRISPLGIACGGRWTPRKQYCAWDDIVAVRYVTICGLHGFELHSPQLRRPLHVPWRLGRRQQFWAMVNDWVAPESALATVIRDHGLA
jgi:hypothetical protein